MPVAPLFHGFTRLVDRHPWLRRLLAVAGFILVIGAVLVSAAPLFLGG